MEFQEANWDSGINYTGASMNPARTLGPSVLQPSFPGYLWIYFVGPLVGAIGAAGLYHLLKAMAYWTANPDQDHDGLEYHRVMTIPQATDGEHSGAYGHSIGRVGTTLEIVNGDQRNMNTSSRHYV